ncbi:MAG: hypothetical protein JRJ68_04785 [Deltaproteobacteria bacterium]|nr:hypothetical protein [Deltaproteobacteria bacterium]
MNASKTKGAGIFIVGTGILFAMWAVAAIIGGLSQVNWQVTELARQYLVASGMVKPVHTLVDFYTHIKGVEYIICVAFFVAFPVFFKYVNKEKTHVRMSTGSH